jgi:hypothetical protein
VKTRLCQKAFPNSGIIFQIHCGVLIFVVILQAVGRGNGKKNSGLSKRKGLASA